ncbi:MAG: tRNA (adenosine(37)-N6)-threonylcarbamoyltransferase complex ATPase subunit type 1 TsaE [Erysipelotrichaceae bacterium]
MEFLLKDTNDTILFGEKLGALASIGMTFCMQGDLGAGKTTMTKGIAKALHIKKNITSPTFTILKIYYGDMPLYHFDAYRLEGLSQDLGFEEYIDADGLSVIEWSTYLSDLFEDYLMVDIKITEDDSRMVTLTAKGDIYEKLIKEFIW